jgi:uridylate kinase
MAKNGVEGVYSADPAVDPSAEFLPEISHMEAVERRLRVMDTTALTLCMENKLPIVVFDLTRPGNIRRIVCGEPVGSVVTSST